MKRSHRYGNARVAPLHAMHPPCYFTQERAEETETFETLENAVALDASTYFGRLDRSRFIGQHRLRVIRLWRNKNAWVGRMKLCAGEGGSLWHTVDILSSSAMPIEREKRIGAQ